MARYVEEDIGQIFPCGLVVDPFELFDALFSSLVDLIFRLTLTQESIHLIQLLFGLDRHVIELLLANTI